MRECRDLDHVSLGIDTMFRHHYVKRFNAVATSRMPMSNGVLVLISVKTCE